MAILKEELVNFFRTILCELSTVCALDASR